MPRYSLHSALLITDMAQTVLRQGRVQRAYTPSGYMPGQQCELAFTGQLRDVGVYLMGNGYRVYQPALNRFSSPDTLSPFERGGLNAYAYCGADPINRHDRDGASWSGLLGRLFSRSESVRPLLNTLELRYAGLGQGRVLRFASSEVVDNTSMYKALGTQLSGSPGSFAVMARNAELVKESAKTFIPLPAYAPLRDSSVFRKAIELQQSTIWGREAIKPITPGDWPALPQGPLNLKNSDVRRTVLSYLYYQEMADPAVVKIRGRVDPW